MVGNPSLTDYGKVLQRREHGIDDVAGDRRDCITSVNVPLLGRVSVRKTVAQFRQVSYSFSSAFPSAIRAEYAEMGRKKRCLT